MKKYTYPLIERRPLYVSHEKMLVVLTEHYRSGMRGAFVRLVARLCFNGYTRDELYTACIDAEMTVWLDAAYAERSVVNAPFNTKKA